MKISKTLLGAIAVGVAVQVTVSSCTKAEVRPQSEKKIEKPSPNNQPPNCEPCPACGMG